jgi:ABC-type oligopeptide transport system substrate-binding subunit
MRIGSWPPLILIFLSLGAQAGPAQPPAPAATPAQTPTPATVAAKPAAAPTERRLRVVIPQDFITLDWAKSSHLVTRPVLLNLQEGLLRMDSKRGVQPALARRWSTSADGRVIRFELRPGVVWSDGEPLTSRHFRDAWRRVLLRSTASPWAPLFFDIAGAQDYNAGKTTDFGTVGIKTPSPNVLEVTLRRPSPEWLYVLIAPFTFPIREELIARFGGDWTLPGNLVNLGPFLLTAHEHGKSITLRRNPRYYRPGGNVDRVDFMIMRPDEGLALFERKQVELLTRAPAASRAALARRKEFQVATPSRVKRLSFNLGRYPLTEVAFRRAVAQALDRAKLARESGPGYRAGASYLPPSVRGFRPTGGLKFDPAAARAALRPLLRTAGALKPLTLLVPTFDENEEENLRTAAFIKNSLKRELAIDVTIEAISEYSLWTIQARSGSASLVLHDWTGDYPSARAYFTAYSDQKQLNSSWNDPEYLKLLDQAAAERDDSRRVSLYQKADRMLTEQYAVMVPLFYAADTAMVSPKVRGFTLSQYADFFNFGELRIQP